MAACAVLLGGLAMAACDGGGRLPPSAGGPERLEWDQQAPSVENLRSMVFRLYVNDEPFVLVNTRCGDKPGLLGYPCSSPLPPLDAGPNVLELTSTVGGVESPRSAPLKVNGTPSGQTTGGGAGTPQSVAPPRASENEDSSRDPVCVAASSRCYQASVVARTPEPIQAVAPTPDGRVLFVEGAGRVRVLQGDMTVTAPALTLDHANRRIVGIAIDADFAATRFVFVAWTEARPDGGTTLQVTRYREVNNTLGEGAQIVTGFPAPAGTPVPLGVDAHGLLHLALPTVSDPPGGSPDTLEGLLLRFDRDGFAPRDNPRRSPILSHGFTRPTSLDIDDALGRVWLTGATDRGPYVGSVDPALAYSSTWPSPPVLVDTSATAASSAALAIAPSMDPPLMMLVGDGRLFLTQPLADGRLAIIGELSLGVAALGAAGAAGGRWYLSVDPGTGAGEIVMLVPFGDTP